MDIKDILALVISSISLVISCKNYINSRPNLKIIVRDFYTDSFSYTREGTFFTLINVRFYNSSPLPITIENIRLKEGPGHSMSRIERIGEINFTEYSFSNKYRQVSISDSKINKANILSIPKKLEPYEYIDGYCFFTSIQRNILMNFDYVTLQVITASNKKYSKRVKVYRCSDLKFSKNEKLI